MDPVEVKLLPTKVGPAFLLSAPFALAAAAFFAYRGLSPDEVFYAAACVFVDLGMTLWGVREVRARLLCRRQEALFASMAADPTTSPEFLAALQSIVDLADRSPGVFPVKRLAPAIQHRLEAMGPDGLARFHNRLAAFESSDLATLAAPANPA